MTPHFGILAIKTVTKVFSELYLYPGVSIFSVTISLDLQYSLLPFLAISSRYSM